MDADFKIAGIILAAGASSRMGRPKLLLPWNGVPLICHSARTALAAGLDPLMVVTGAAGEEIQGALAGLDVRVVDNPHWASGQSTSLRAGLQALPGETQAVIFLLGDQPYVSVELLQALKGEYARTRAAVIAPYVGEKRSNPVLFDRSLFGLLLGLQGDAGGRVLFGQHPPAQLPWPDERLLVDIDTPEDYQKLTEE